MFDAIDDMMGAAAPAAVGLRKFESLLEEGSNIVAGMTGNCLGKLCTFGTCVDGSDGCSTIRSDSDREEKGPCRPSPS